MKLSERWLREWTDPDVDHLALAEILTLIGLEVDAVDAVAAPLPGVVAAEVRAVAPHPEADRLAVCTVHDGRDTHTVVCGAPNVRVGLRVAYARPGARLPGAPAIAASSIRGIASHGMLCSAAELGLGEDAAGLLELDADAPCGAPLDGVLGLDDRVFDIGLTPNRGDCFCVLGIARDVAVATGAPLREAAVDRVVPSVDAVLPIELAAPAACPRYAGRILRGIDPTARTPLWLRERLRRAGVRAIHPVVDVTNYVMLELGQPMHAFDLARLEGGIVVREARADERLRLLDDTEVALVPGTLVIADAVRPVALAGVMGGAASAVGAATVDVFLESAYFDPVRVAGVARHCHLQTDASTRFERGVDPSAQTRAMERASALILEFCGGAAGPVVCVESCEHVPGRAPIAFRPAAVDRLLGTRIAEPRIAEILRALHMQLDTAATPWQVVPPAFRFDLALEADLIEEVARIEGYDAIPSTLPRGAGQPALPEPQSALEQLTRESLIARAYYEAVTYSFVAPEMARHFAPHAHPERLSNPISSAMAVLRPSLWPGLVAAAMHNLNRQAEDVRLFEIGAVFGRADAAGNVAQSTRIGGVRAGFAQLQHWAAAPRATDFFDVKQDTAALLARWGQARATFAPATHPALHPGQCARIELDGREIGVLGALHPALARQLDIAKPLFLFDLALPIGDLGDAPQYRPVSRFPAVRRDLNVVVDEEVRAADCLAAARAGGGASLRDLQLFDVYQGQGIDSGKKSLTLGLIFQVGSSTLTEDEVEVAVTRILAELRERVGGVLRK